MPEKLIFIRDNLHHQIRFHNTALKKHLKPFQTRTFYVIFFQSICSINIMTRKWHKGLFRALNDPAESYC